MTVRPPVPGLFIIALFVAVVACSEEGEPERRFVGIESGSVDGEPNPPLSVFERTRCAAGFNEVRARTHERGSASVVVFSHDGRRLAMCEGYAMVVRILDTETWAKVASVDVEFQVLDLVYSPDDRYLYVACGESGPRELARFDARTGVLDRRYDGLKDHVLSMAVSPDGRVLVTLDNHGFRLVFREARTGEILRARRAHGTTLPVAPDGSGVILHHGERCLVPWRGDEDRPFLIPGGEYAGRLKKICSTPDGARYACAYVHPAQWTGSVRVFEHVEDGGTEVARLKVEQATMLEHVALSPDGRFLAAAGHGNVVRLWSVPDMELLHEKRLPPPCNPFLNISVTGLEFAPDSRTLAVAREEPTPIILRVDEFERFLPWPGHADQITDLFFIHEGKRIRTIGRDGTICVWNSRTLKRLSRSSLPEGYEVAAVRGPEGDLLLARAEALPGAEWPSGRPALIFDAVTGETVRETVLPTGFAKEGPLWVPGREELVLIGDDLDRFALLDSASGELGAARRADLPENAEITPDGRQIFGAVRRDKTGFDGSARRIDIATGRAETVQPLDTASPCFTTSGLVPGGRHYYLAGSGLRLFELQTGELVVERSFGGASFEGISFSEDGTRHTVVLAGGEVRRSAEEGTWCVAQVLETKTGRVLHALALDMWGRAILSPDGERLAFVGNDGVLRVYTFGKR